jgi:hypothetical protein
MPEIPDQPTEDQRRDDEALTPVELLLYEHFRYLACPSPVDPVDTDDCAGMAVEVIRFLTEKGVIQDWESAYRAGREDAARDVLAALRRREDGAQETYARRQALGIGDQAAEWAVRSRAWRQARQAAEEAVIARRDDERRASEAGRRAGGEDAALEIYGDTIRSDQLIKIGGEWMSYIGARKVAKLVIAMADEIEEEIAARADQPRTLLPGEVQDDQEAQR